jgi:hypothetical protein
MKNVGRYPADRGTAAEAFFIDDLSHLARDCVKAFTWPHFLEIEGLVTS